MKKSHAAAIFRAERFVILRKLLLLGFLFLAQNASVIADPYAKEYNQARTAAYEAARAQFLGEVRTLWFAMGCKAIDGASIVSLYTSEQATMGAALNNGPIQDPELGALWEKAKREGTGMANDHAHHVCDYWRNNPDALYALRQEADDAARMAQ